MKRGELTINYVIVIILALLVLIVIAIIFRNHIKIWWFKYKGKAKVTPVVRPGVPPSGMTNYRPAQPVYRPAPSGYSRPAPQRAPPVRKPVSTKDKEMEETLKKLRDMSK